jgi:hypothetical protein
MEKQYSIGQTIACGAPPPGRQAFGQSTNTNQSTKSTAACPCVGAISINDPVNQSTARDGVMC